MKGDWNLYFLIARKESDHMDKENIEVKTNSEPLAEQPSENLKEKGSAKKILISIRDFIAKTTNGMAIGLFGTLIIGTIIALFAKIPGAETVGVLANAIKALMGAGIGL